MYGLRVMGFGFVRNYVFIIYGPHIYIYDTFGNVDLSRLHNHAAWNNDRKKKSMIETKEISNEAETQYGTQNTVNNL